MGYQARLAFVVALIGAAAAPATAVTLFNETFDGYTSFPSQHPAGDYINPGIARPSEGSDEIWYGIRLGPPDSSASIDSDLAVQQCGDDGGGAAGCNSGTNRTPVGRFEDDAGLVFQISTVGVTDALLEFDWRTFSTTKADKVRVGYFASATALPFSGGAPGDVGGYLDARTGAFSWANWTELMRAGQQGSFKHEAFALPDEVAYLYVAFWIDDGEGDFGKIDNVLVSANAVPEPGALALLALAGAARAARRRRS